MTKKESGGGVLPPPARSSEKRRTAKGAAAVSKVGKAGNQLTLPKKNLNSDFGSVVDGSKESLADLSPDGISVSGGLEQLGDLSPVSEVVDGVSPEDLSLKVDSPLSVSRDAFPVSELTPNSTITTESDEPSKERHTEHVQSGESNNMKMKSVEADLVVEHLKRAWSQIQQSDALDNQSKKLVCALIKMGMETCYGFTEDHDLLSRIVKAKTQISVACLLVWMVLTLGVVYVKCYTGTEYFGPQPT